MPSRERVSGAVAELYGADPAEFTARRKSLADEARAAGERDAAKEIAALRKPTRAAWVVNTLARADPDAPDRLAQLGAELRAAAESRDGQRLRELSARRGELIDALAGQALEAAGVAEPSAALRSEVTETLTSAMADPDTARGFAAGTLTRPAEWAGFGAFTPPAETSAPPAPPSKRARDGGAGAARPRKAAHDKPTRDTERMVAASAEAAAAAVAREEELEARVRTLEEQLTKARADLAAARTKARRAESALKRVRATGGRR